MKTFINFCVVGASSAVVMYMTYFVTWKLCGNYYVANVMGFLFSTSNSFFWNNRIVFKGRAKTKHDMVLIYIKTMLLYAFTGLVISNLLLYMWVDVFGISELVAPIINIAIVTPLNFILNKFWAFGKNINVS